MNSILKDEKIKINPFAIKDVRRLFFNHYKGFQKETLHRLGVVRENKGKHTFLKGLSIASHIPAGIENYEEIYAKYFSQIQNIVRNKEIVVKKPLEENTYIFLTEILYLEILLHKIRNGQNYQSSLKKFHLATKQRFEVIEVKAQNGHKHEKKGRATLLEPNANSYIWTRESRESIGFEINELLSKINPKLIEIPFDYDKERLTSALKNISRTLETLRVNNRDFIIRFKKLGTYKKSGVYIKPAKTIVVDAKQAHIFQHELGHYLFEENIPFWYKGEEYTKEKMKAIVGKEKEEDSDIEERLKSSIRKDEGYKIDSEIFANWFEKI